MQAELTRLVDGFGESPLIKGKLMREMLESDRNQFRSAAIPLLKNLSDERGCRYLVTLLWTHNLLIQSFCDESALRLEEAVNVAKAVARVDSQLHVRLLQHLLDGFEAGNDTGEEGGAGRLLEIVSAVADRGSVLPLLTQLLRHPNPRIRSKVALLIGRSNKSAKWLEKRMAEEDPRVRANAIEALWGVEGEQSRAILWEAAKDSHDRIAGNALVGLYRVGDVKSIPAILDMAETQEVSRRTTAAWAMGETRDPRFLLVLGRMLGDAQGNLRKTVFHAITAIKSGSLLGAPRDRLRVSIVDGRLAAGSGLLRAIVTDSEVQPVSQLPATRFLISVNGIAMAKYSVEEHSKPAILTVGFALSRRVDAADPYRRACENALLPCLRNKRASDLWCILKYADDSEAVPQTGGGERLFGQDMSAPAATGATTSSTDDVTFTANPQHLRPLIERAGLRMELPETACAAAERLIHGMASARGARHLILLQDQTPPDDAEKVAQLLPAAQSYRVAVHMISLVDSEAWRGLCGDSGGTFQRLDSPESLAGALEKLYSSLLFRYELQYQVAQTAESGGASHQVRLQVFTPEGQGEATISIG